MQTKTTTPEVCPDGRMTAEEIEANYQAWRADFRARIDALRVRVSDAFTRGETVTEIWPNGARTGWRSSNSPAGARSCFIPSAETPAYLTDHLMNRHEYFGLGLAFEDGSEYALGKLRRVRDAA
jgi:hypothetical protein